MRCAWLRAGQGSEAGRRASERSVGWIVDKALTCIARAEQSLADTEQMFPRLMPSGRLEQHALHSPGVVMVGQIIHCARPAAQHSGVEHRQQRQDAAQRAAAARGG